MKKNCIQCGDEFEADRHKAKFCSERCAARNRKPKNPMEDCVLCLRSIGFGYSFIAKRTNTNKGLVRKWCLRDVAMPELKRVKSTPVMHNYQPAKDRLIGNALIQLVISHSIHFYRVPFNRTDYARMYYRIPRNAIVNSLRSRVRQTIRAQGGLKRHHAQHLLGCDRATLMLHLQSQFKSGMNWNNYGSVWEIDHRTPCSSFNLLDEDEQRKCFHYTNLQPLSVHDNRSKWATVDWKPD